MEQKGGAQLEKKGKNDVVTEHRLGLGGGGEGGGGVQQITWDWEI